MPRERLRIESYLATAHALKPYRLGRVAPLWCTIADFMRQRIQPHLHHDDKAVVLDTIGYKAHAFAHPSTVGNSRAAYQAPRPWP